MVFIAPWPFTVTPFSRFSAFGEDRQTTFDCDICIHISFLAGPLHCLFVSQCLRLLLVSGFCCCVAVQHQSSTDSLARLLGAHSSWLPYEHYQNLWYSSWTPRLVLFTYWKEWWAVKTLCYVKRGEWEFAHCSGKLMSPPSSAYTLCETRVKICFDLVIVGITIGKWVHMNYWRVK